ncbi:hypothetical protein [Haloarcula onubensis]|uniref:MarR family transcriptional regulator n=1 Tax=Haloarcula onubensis TaxID=2950539 RepID=A0ABU2FWW5_9EURY|nr:hypothetical protein [Halomicroarcula sp. S3CR25-11]MDS0284741.1 hypothetical protein [Halomicroarcula sp. S3CR25-11]
MSSPTHSPDRASVFPAPVRASTPTAAAVYAVLDATGPLTYDQLVDETGAGRTAVENAVADLRDRGIIDSRPDPDDPPRQLHDIADSFDA